jgi:hypothetical protein
MSFTHTFNRYLDSFLNWALNPSSHYANDDKRLRKRVIQQSLSPQHSRVPPAFNDLGDIAGQELLPEF